MRRELTLDPSAVGAPTQPLVEGARSLILFEDLELTAVDPGSAGDGDRGIVQLSADAEPPIPWVDEEMLEATGTRAHDADDRSVLLRDDDRGPRLRRRQASVPVRAHRLIGERIEVGRENVCIREQRRASVQLEDRADVLDASGTEVRVRRTRSIHGLQGLRLPDSPFRRSSLTYSDMGICLGHVTGRRDL